MPSSKCLVRPVREVAIRSRPHFARRQPISTTAAHQQDKDQQPKVTPLPEGTTSGANESQIPHVSVEQAQIDETMGQTPPDLTQGTPVQDILQRDKDAQSNAPQVIKDQLKNGQKRQYSTSARRPALAWHERSSISKKSTKLLRMDYPEADSATKFGLPPKNSLGPLDHLKRRYDPVVEQLTRGIMRDGKLSQAQKNMSAILDILRTTPPPQVNPSAPNRTLLLADTPQEQPPPPVNRPGSLLGMAVPEVVPITQIPRAALPMYPVEYLTTIIDSVAPMLKVKQMKGMAGGGASTPIPIPLGVRQRRRQAIQWILQAAESRRELKLADRVGKELIRVAEGQSNVWEKRELLHRLGISARSNIRMTGRRR